jgi:hypothetical protein
VIFVAGILSAAWKLRTALHIGRRQTANLGFGRSVSINESAFFYFALLRIPKIDNSRAEKLTIFALVLRSRHLGATCHAGRSVPSLKDQGFNPEPMHQSWERFSASSPPYLRLALMQTIGGPVIAV